MNLRLFCEPLFALAYALPTEAGVPAAAAAFILVVAAVAGCCQLSLLGRYRRARALLKQVRARLKGPISFDDVKAAMLDAAGSPPRGAGRLLADFLEHAVRRGTEFQPAAAVELLAVRERQLGRAAIARWVGGAALVLGLAGTFLAFTQIVVGSGLMEALRSLRNTPQAAEVSPQLADSYAQLSTAFTRVYEGFGYAFLASLAGVAGTLALGFCNTVLVTRALGGCLARLEDLGEQIFRPLLAPRANQGEDFSAALRSAASVLGETGEALVSLRDTARVLDRAAARFDKSQGAGSELAGTLAKLAIEIESSRQRWDVLLGALREGHASMGRSVEEFKQEATAQRELSQAATAATLQGLRQIVAEMSGEIQRVSAAKLDHFVAVQNDAQRLLAESKKDWERASTALLAKTDEGFRLALEKVQEVIQDGRNDAAEARRSLASLTHEVAAVVTDHRAALGAHAQAVTDSLRQWADAPAALTETVRQGGAVLDRLAGTLAALNEMPARWESRVLGSIKQLDVKLNETGARLDRGTAFERWQAQFQSWLARRRRGG